MERAQRTCGSFSSVHIERNQMIPACNLLPFAGSIRSPLINVSFKHIWRISKQTSNVMALVGASVAFMWIVCVCVLFVAMRRRAGVLPTFVHALTWEANACIWKNLERSRACDTLTTLRCSSNRNQSRKRNRGHPNVLPQLAMLSPGLRGPMSSIKKTMLGNA